MDEKENAMPLTFEPIRMEQQDDYRIKLAQCRQIASDYSFTNLFGWGPEFGLEWAWHDGLVWIRQALPFPALWAPVGDWDAVDWPSRIPAVTALADRIIRIPEALRHIWQKALFDGFRFLESRGQWDYLYRIEDLAQLKGNRFHKKKNLVNQFKKSYSFEYLAFGPEMVSQALAMQEDWCTWRDCESHDTLAAENKAIARILNQWRHLKGLTGSALRVDDILVAYTIAERMPDQTVVIHFEKGNPAFKGSYQAINQLFLENLTPGAGLVNREQDLDNDGLRKAKLSYHPVDYLKKYELTF
jgi:hypothetical protein